MINFNKQLQSQFDKMCQTGKLFRSSITGDQVWNTYLNSFDHDPMFRDPESSEHNCNLCKNFIRRYGNIVAVNENFQVMTMFDFDGEGEFKPVTAALAYLLGNGSIKDVFIETYDELNSLPYEVCKKSLSKFRLGTDKNVKRYTKEEAEKFGIVKPNEVRTFNHMHLGIPAQFIDKTGSSAASIMGDFRAAKEVFERAMIEIHIDTLNLVRDLINQGSLLNGASHLFKIEAIIPKKLIYDELSASVKSNWLWLNSYKFQFAKIRNEAIGTLLVDLTEGKELNAACQAWNKMVDPANYMKATAPITKKQIEEARKFVEDNGYVESFDRRFATIDDIKISEILHANSGDGSIPKVSIFDSVRPAVSTRHKRSEFDNVEEITIEKFMKDVLPSCTSVEAFLTNQHDGNMVSLTTANVKESSPIFKWSNNYSWTFNGNLAGKSQIKENVKKVGGKIEGVLRCSLQWNDEDTPGIIDFDLHCITPFMEIYYSDKRDQRSGGWLDIDMINPSKIGIENITWQQTLKDGRYNFFVKNFSDHERQQGFKVEIEFDGETFNYHYPKSFKGNINVATVNVKNGVMSITHHLPETSTSKDIYGLNTNKFHKVNLVCLSPNHWNGESVGNKHYFFMLDNCKSPISIRSFHAENLIPELATHRKVLEVLGGTTMIQSTDKQLSGLGFNATVKDELIVKVQGSFKRMLKIKF